MLFLTPVEIAGAQPWTVKNSKRTKITADRQELFDSHKKALSKKFDFKIFTFFIDLVYFSRDSKVNVNEHL